MWLRKSVSRCRQTGVNERQQQVCAVGQRSTFLLAATGVQYLSVGEKPKKLPIRENHTCRRQEGPKDKVVKEGHGVGDACYPKSPLHQT